MILGIILVIVSSFIVNYLLGMSVIKENYSLPIPYDLFIVSIIFLITFIVYGLIQKKKTKLVLEDVELLKDKINEFVSNKEFRIEAQSSELSDAFVLLNNVFNEISEKYKKDVNKIKFLEQEKEKIETILDLENVSILRVSEAGKVIKANKLFLKLSGFKTESQINLKLKHIFDIFEDNLDKDLVKLIEKDIFVTIKKTKFILHIEKVSQDMSYVITLIDITKCEEEKTKILKKTEYASENLKTIFSINKSQETVMIRMLNYDNYASYLGSGIMEVFEDKFAEKIKQFGYEEIFKVQNNTFAVYDFHINFDDYKKTLEENIIITVGKDRYIFSPKIILASGVNFEQAYQQVLESGKTLVSKEKTNSTYNLEMIKYINRTILANNIKLGYKSIINHNDMIFIYPIVTDEYGVAFAQNEIENITREFNLYLYILKQVIVNHLNIIKNYKIIINVSSEDLFSNTMLNDLLSLIKREDLMVVFNVSINSKYSLVYPILKHIKSYAQLGLRNVGHGYISFKDIYTLKIAYLEIDESVIALIQEDKNWEFLLDSIKLLVSEQKVNLLTNNYSDDKVSQISKELKIYN